MSAHEILINREEAELLVDLLEYNYQTGKFYHAGEGIELAEIIRKKFGMCKQPELIYKEFCEIKK